MIYKFRILSDEVDDFIRVFEVPDNLTFYDFHLALQKELNYDNSQVASFYTSNEEWDKLQEFSLFDPAEDNKSITMSMGKSILKDFISEKKERLLYVFDIFSERILFIELVDIITDNNKGLDKPKCTFSAGKAPQQILMDDIQLEDMDKDMDFEALNPDFEDTDMNYDPDIEDMSFDDE